MSFKFHVEIFQDHINLSMISTINID